MAKASSGGPWLSARAVGFRSSSQHGGSRLRVCEDGGLTGLLFVPSWINGILCFSCKTHTNMDKPEEAEAKQGHVLSHCNTMTFILLGDPKGSDCYVRKPSSSQEALEPSFNQQGQQLWCDTVLCQSQAPQGDTDWPRHTFFSCIRGVLTCSYMERDLCLERRGQEKAESMEFGC